MIEEITIHSDRCTLKELVKIDEVFDKELKRQKKSAKKVRIWKFLKEENKMKTHTLNL